jgi:hypothetical protein
MGALNSAKMNGSPKISAARGCFETPVVSIFRKHS